MSPYCKKSDGFEMHKQVSYLGHFPNLVLEKLKKTSPPGLIIESSLGHYLKRFTYMAWRVTVYTMHYCHSK